MRKSGVVSKDVKGKDNEVYHDIISLFKIYRSVNWCKFRPTGVNISFETV